MFKKLILLLCLCLFNMANGCEIPEDIKNRYEEAIQHMKDKQINGSDIYDYKRKTLGIGDRAGSYWFSRRSKSNKAEYEKDCKKKEEYYRKAYNMLIEEEKARKRLGSSVTMYINEQYYNSAIDVERDMRSKARNLATYDNL